VFLCYDTTGSSDQQESVRRLCDPRDDTKSLDLVFGRVSHEKCLAMQGDSLVALVVLLKGLILRQEIEGREEGNADRIAVL